MLRALAAAAAAVAVAAVSGGGATASSGEATGSDGPRCDFAARAAGDRAIAFRLRCTFEPTQLKVRPSVGVRQAAHPTQVKPPRDRDGFACERALDGKLLLCNGHMEDGATLHGRLWARGDACRSSIAWRAFGGVDCDAGEVCAAVGLFAAGEVRRPRDC